MYLIAGLGNPGLKYRHTRHNVGFDAIDILAKNASVAIRKKEKNGLTAQTVIEGEKVLLVKPQTFMNNSGECVGALADFYKVPPEHIIVFSDDIALPCGKLRIRKKGSAGGHNGLKNIIAHLHSEEFLRVRIGVGSPPPGDDMIIHVLSRPGKADGILIKQAQENAAAAVALLVSGRIDEAMNRFN